jgi:hypothetical protein
VRKLVKQRALVSWWNSSNRESKPISKRKKHSSNWPNAAPPTKQVKQLGDQLGRFVFG